MPLLIGHQLDSGDHSYRVFWISHRDGNDSFEARPPALT